MQTFTTAQCSALTTYTGTNDSAIISLTDSRGGTTQTYRVAKLVDGHCWMLDNLKLGSTTGTIPLTPSDTNIAANFTLPQLYAGTDSAYGSYDAPFTYGPVPGDTGSGDTSYGYLYNWPAATAGETQTTMPAGSGNAAHDICAKGWRLPSGGTDGEFATLDIAFGGDGGGLASFNNEPSLTITLADYRTKLASTESDDSWRSTGAFKGTYAGNWWNGFYDQGASGVGDWWSRSADSYYALGAFSAGVDSDGVNAGGYSDRYLGNSVRCFLN